MIAVIVMLDKPKLTRFTISSEKLYFLQTIFKKPLTPLLNMFEKAGNSLSMASLSDEDDSDDNSNVGDSSSDGTQETFVKASPPLCWGGYPCLMPLIEGPCSDK